MNISGKSNCGYDPRAKLILLLLCVLTASMACSLAYECVLIAAIAAFGISNGKYKSTLTGTLIFFLFYGFTLFYVEGTGTLHTMFLAWMGLFYKVYPCGMLAGIILSTTRVNEFMSAMHRARIPKRVVIPLAVMLRYIPTVREDWRFIKDAMGLRDVSPSLRGFLTNPARTVECLYVPLMMAASKAADELAIASVTRGIENPAPRTCLVSIRFRRRDWAVTALFLAVFLVNIGLKEGIAG